MKKLFSLLAFTAMIAISSQTSFTQVAGYGFTQSSQTYTEITGGTLLVSTTWDDNLFTAQPIGFNFDFNGIVYTSVGISANGYLIFGAVAPTTSYCAFETATNPNMVCAFGGDIRNNTLSPSEIRYQTLGCAPNRYFVLQWKNAQKYNAAPDATNSYNFQIILYETPNCVEVRYGPFTNTQTMTLSSCGGTPFTDMVGVGIRTTTADFNSRKITNGSETWSTSIAGTLVTDKCQLSPANVPASGNSYAWRFAVPAPPGMLYSSGTTVTANTGSTFTGATNQEIIGVQVVTCGSTSPFNVTSLDLNTNGSTNPFGDIANAKVYYTGTSPVFSTSNLFGTFFSPNGAFSVSGSQVLASGTNYFWVTYDISIFGTTGDVVDAECSQINMDGAGGSQVPTVQAPAGSRTIASLLAGGTYHVGTSQPIYKKLTDIANTLNGSPITGDVTFLLDADYDGTTGETFPITFNQITSAGGTFYVTIRPDAGVSTRTTSGDPGAAASLIILNGADRIILDGRAGGTTDATEEWIIRNTRVSATLGNVGPTFTFQNDSKRNTLQYLQIEGNSNPSNAVFPPTNATIYFGGTTGSEGNDSNTITFCDIRDRSDLSAFPCFGIAGLGSTTTANTQNGFTTISNNNIYNFFQDGTANATGGAAGGLVIGLGNINWTITANSFYQTAARNNSALTGAQAINWNVLMINNLYDSNMTITNNFLGGSGPGCTGTWTATAPTSAHSTLILRIFAGNTGTNTCSGNQISNFDVTSGSMTAASTISPLLIQQGQWNVNNNVIGSQSVLDNMIYRFNGVTTIAPTWKGIDVRSPATILNMTGNTIGGVTITGTSTVTNIVFDGIVFVAVTPSFVTNSNISNNIVGGSVANSMRNTLPGACNVQMNGMNIGQSGQPYTINNNTVRNLTNSSTSALAIGTASGPGVRGIFTQGTGVGTITNNTVSELRGASTTAPSVSGTPQSYNVVGIVSSCSGTGTTVRGNTVSGIRSTNLGVNNTGVLGLGVTGAATSTVSRNRIYDLTNTSTGAAPFIYGTVNYTGTWTFSSNQITITNGEATDFINQNPVTDRFRNITSPDMQVPVTPNTYQKANISDKTGSTANDVNSGSSLDASLIQPVTEEIQKIQPPPTTIETDASTNGVVIYGMLEYNGSAAIYYYNSIYVGGTAAAGTANSYAFARNFFTSPMTVRNNLCVNARTGGTGKHYAIFNYSATNWTATTSNYNSLIGSNAATMGLWIAADQTLALWKTTALGDKQTWGTVTSDVIPTSLFTSISTGNLGIVNSYLGSWIVSGKGIAVAGQNFDYSGSSRVVSITSGVTDIGSIEFGTPSLDPPVAFESAAPSGGTTTTYTLWGRTIASIDWGAGGSYPTAISAKYWSGINPPGVSGGNYANSYSDVIPTGTLSGALYDITYFFGDNETGTISTPGTNTVLAKYNSSWEVYPIGINPWQTQLTYNTGTAVYTTKVTGLDGFSSFALSDGTSPLPVVLTRFDASVVNRDVTLNWETSSEINNKGFAVEKRIKTGEGVYAAWKEISFVNGRGNSNERVSYSFTDKKLNSGMYQYRLRQVDFNGSYEYHSPANNTDVVVGKPGTFDLSQNYPNPSNPKSKIDFQMPFDGRVSIKVYDILGKEISSLIDEFKTADFYTVEFDGSNTASGIYFYRIIAESGNQKFTKTMKMILVK